jgi:hypothetical protein
MYTRQSLLSLSLVVSLLLHAAILALAPRITVSSLHMPTPRPIKNFKVEFNREVPPPPEPERTEGVAAKKELNLLQQIVAEKPESISNPDSLMGKTVDIPALSQRVASEVVERPHYLEPDPQTLQAIDAKIIEISQDVARKEIDIPRRVVSPSPDRLLAANESPALRAPDDTGDGPIGFGGLPSFSLLGEPAHPAGTAAGEPQKPAYEDNAIAGPMPPPMEQAALPESHVAPVVEQIRTEKPYEFMDDLLDVSLETYRNGDEKSGYFRLKIAPKQSAKIEGLPKDVTFVIDASNSILQRKLDFTSKATRDIIKTLRPEDMFNVIIFRETAKSLSPSAVPATEENKKAAATFLTGLQSSGQTDVYNAMRPVINISPRPGLPGIVLLMTDGRPTTGVRDARAIINSLSEEKVIENSIFAYGGGNTVNRYLLDLLAYRNKGESRVAPTIEAIDQDLPRFFAKFQNPILVNLNANFGQIQKDEVYPRDVPDFYSGRGVTIYGRFDPKKDSEFVMQLKGHAKEKEKEVIFKENLSKAATGDAEIARSWAFEKVYFLIDRICKEGETPELLNEIRSLSKKYNIRTSYDE